MSKFAQILTVFLLLIALTPLAQADSDQPITIKSAVVETEDSRVVGTVKVCNSERERVRFVLGVKNLTINSIYKRRLSVAASDCTTIKLRFTRNIAEMSNTGDKVEFRAKRVRGVTSGDKYDSSDSYETLVVKGKRDYAGCVDQAVLDGVFGACESDFIYHLPSGLRVKVLDSNPDYVELKLVHIEWGGVKMMRIYKGRTKEITSDQNKRVELTNVYGENARHLFLKLETTS